MKKHPIDIFLNARNYTRAKFADESGYSNNTIGTWVNRKDKSVLTYPLDFMLTISSFFGLTVEEVANELISSEVEQGLNDSSEFSTESKPKMEYLENARKEGIALKNYIIKNSKQGMLVSRNRKLLDALKLKNKDEFLNIILEICYVLRQPVPSCFDGSSEYPFNEIAYSFMIGFI